MGSKAFLPYAETDPGVPAHEAGHLMGLPDRYSHKTLLPEKGWDGNIMVDGLTGKVDARNIRAIIRNKDKIRCTH
jgi:hypothetical protein